MFLRLLLDIFVMLPSQVSWVILQILHQTPNRLRTNVIPDANVLVVILLHHNVFHNVQLFIYAQICQLSPLVASRLVLIAR